MIRVGKRVVEAIRVAHVLGLLAGVLLVNGSAYGQKPMSQRSELVPPSRLSNVAGDCTDDDGDGYGTGAG